MTQIRVRTSTGWKDLAMVGPTGPQGPAGPAGAPGTIVESVYTVGGWGATLALSSGAWKTLTPHATPVITPAGAFVQNPNGSIGVRDAGWYTVLAGANFTGAGSYRTLSLGGSPDAQGYWAQTTSDSNGVLTTGATIKLEAGWNVYVTASADASGALYYLSIARIGAGPAGPAGAAGAAGPAGAVQVYEQAAQPGSAADGAVWIDTDAVPLVSETIRTMRTGQSYVVGGSLTAGMVIPSFFVPIMGVGQTTKLVGARHKIASGTSVVAQLQQNGTNIGGAMTVTTTKTTTTNGLVTIADGDEIGLVLSSPVGSPANLSMTVIFEHTV